MLLNFFGIKDRYTVVMPRKNKLPLTSLPWDHSGTTPEKNSKENIQKCLEITEESLFFSLLKQPKCKSEQMSLSLLKNGLSQSKFFPPFLSIVFPRGLPPDFRAMSPVTSSPSKASDKGIEPRNHFINRRNNYDHLGEYR